MADEQASNVDSIMRDKACSKCLAVITSISITQTSDGVQAQQSRRLNVYWFGGELCFMESFVP